MKKEIVLKWLFILCGGKFYFDWLLITNPASKNILIKSWFDLDYFKNVEQRLQTAYMFAGIHIVAALINLGFHNFFSLVNLFINLYPIIVQIYIGTRCYWVIQYKKHGKEI